MAGAPQGNKNAKKLTTDELKKEAYQQYCDHLAKGKSQKSFVFIHPEVTLTYKTINKYIAESPIDFPPIQREAAEIKGYEKWEQIVMDSAVGENPNANTASLQMLMRNKFDWDKHDINEITDTAADKVLDAIRKTIS